MSGYLEPMLNKPEDMLIPSSMAIESQCSSSDSTTKIVVVNKVELRVRLSQRTGSEISQADYREL
jgi:hypothetical protein